MAPRRKIPRPAISFPPPRAESLDEYRSRSDRNERRMAAYLDAQEKRDEEVGEVLTAWKAIRKVSDRYLLTILGMAITGGATLYRNHLKQEFIEKQLSEEKNRTAQIETDTRGSRTDIGNIEKLMKKQAEEIAALRELLERLDEEGMKVRRRKRR